MRFGLCMLSRISGLKLLLSKALMFFASSVMFMSINHCFPEKQNKNDLLFRVFVVSIGDFEDGDS